MFRRFGLRSAVRTNPTAHWASWADCLPTFQKRHPGVARMIITRLSDHAGDLHVSGANVSRERLLDVSYNVPSWEQIADGLRPGVPVEDPEPGVPRHGWQFHAAQAMDDCSLSLCPPPLAGVAVHSTTLATTGQRVRRREFSVGDALHLRVLRRECAGKLGSGSHSTCWSVISTCLRGVPIFRSLQTDCLFSTARNWPSTPPWCLQ